MVLDKLADFLVHVSAILTADLLLKDKVEEKENDSAGTESSDDQD
jgi:hypothetical protein